MVVGQIPAIPPHMAVRIDRAVTSVGTLRIGDQMVKVLGPEVADPRGSLQGEIVGFTSDGDEVLLILFSPAHQAGNYLWQYYGEIIDNWRKGPGVKPSVQPEPEVKISPHLPGAPPHMAQRVISRITSVGSLRIGDQMVKVLGPELADPRGSLQGEIVGFTSDGNEVLLFLFSPAHQAGNYLWQYYGEMIDNWRKIFGVDDIAAAEARGKRAAILHAILAAFGVSILFKYFAK